MNREFHDKTLYYFTNSYPFGNSPLWKMNELEVLKRHFRRIVVVPLSNGGSEETRNLVEGVEYMRPIIDKEFSKGGRRLAEKIRVMAGLIRTKTCGYFFREMVSTDVLFRPDRMRLLLKATYELALYQKNCTVRKVFEAANRERSIFYFYWGIGAVNTLLLKAPKELPPTVCRFHGWDLYEDRHETGYIPYRNQLLCLLDLLLPCSTHGAKHLQSKLPSIEDKIFIARLGTTSEGRSELRCDNVLKIVSCSRMVEIKRLDLLCKALSITSIPVRWTHIGDGELMPTVRAYAERFPPNVEADLRGSFPAEDVPRILAGEPFDLFVNTSSSEGVPVSIMEALAAGIPVVATDVGGTSEIVDETVGRLVSSSVDPAELASVFEEFYGLPQTQKSSMRNFAVQRFSERCEVKANAEVLASKLIAATQ